MKRKFNENNNKEILSLINSWYPKLICIEDEVLNTKFNSQNRSIKQILGHLVDSVSNNTHRIIHLQYQPNPMIFPDYANFGSNDTWIAIQNFQNEDFINVVLLWKYANLHFVHVLENVNEEKLDNEWINALGESITLRQMIEEYLPHLKLHLNEIQELLN